MMKGAPVKKEFHFAATSEHYSEVVHAHSLQEAEAIYHRVKRPINQPEAALSTPATDGDEEEVE